MSEQGNLKRKNIPIEDPATHQRVMQLAAMLTLRDGERRKMEDVVAEAIELLEQQLDPATVTHAAI